MDKNNPPPPSDNDSAIPTSKVDPFDQGFGDWLRAHRTAKNVSLEEIAAVTKVHISQLQNLEAEQFTKLPAAAFVRGFLISYARYVDIDEDEMLTRYRRASGADKRDAESPRAIRAAQSSSQARVKVVDFPNFQNAPSSRARDPEPSKIFNPRNAAFVAGGLAVMGLVFFLITLGRKAATSKKTEPAPVAATANPVDPAPVAPPVEAVPPTTPGTAVKTDEKPVDDAKPETKKTYDFEIRALEPTWLSVRADDEDPKGITLQPSKNHVGGAQRRVNLSLSNAGVVEIRWGSTWYESPGFRGDVRALQLPEQLGELKPKGSTPAKTPKRIAPARVTPSAPPTTDQAPPVEATPAAAPPSESE